MGGMLGGGTLFRLNSDGSEYASFYSFSNVGGAADGPFASLILGQDGALYGTTDTDDGFWPGGTVFKVNLDGSGYTLLHRLDASTGDGTFPVGGVIQAADGMLYGSTMYGGSSTDAGTVYRLSPDGSAYNVLHTFGMTEEDGAAPAAGLIQASDGALYGTTTQGGSFGLGTIFKLNSDGSSYRVVRALSQADGTYTFAGLVQGRDGYLYGLGNYGGDWQSGTIFQLSCDGSGFRVLHSFSQIGGDGAFGEALIQGRGAWYGTTRQGGLFGTGTLFKFDPDGGGYAILHHFNNTDGDGFWPGGLVESDDGALYGATNMGGDVQAGTIYRMTVPLNHAPLATPQTLLVTKNTSLAVTLTAEDLDGDPLTFFVSSNPTHGSLSGTPPNLVYTPDSGYNGPDSFAFQVNDGSVNSAAATVSIGVINYPPVANAGPSQTVECSGGLAQVTLDGHNSSDPNGGALTYSWSAGGTVLGTGVNLPFGFGIGNHVITLTVTDASNASAQATVTINVVSAASTTTSISPSSAPAGSPAVGLLVNGSCFPQGAVVLWNGSPQNTTYINDTQLEAQIPGSELASTTDLTLVSVTVQNPGGGISNPQVFTIVQNSANVAALDSASATSSEPVTVAVSPSSDSTGGVTATLTHEGDQPAAVAVATYSSDPSPGTNSFTVAGQYADVNVSGATANDTMTVSFFYPAGIGDPGMTLQFFNENLSPPNWDVVTPATNYPDERRWEVVFSATSHPAITELKGTYFAAALSKPSIAQIDAPAAPLALGSSCNLTLHYTALSYAGVQPAITVDWGDGSSTSAVQGNSGLARATHLYAAQAAPGVFTVTVRLIDAFKQSTTASYQYVVVYDPNGGFVTGGGWINSPAGAYALNPRLTGKANFGFNSKYQKGATVPSGQTQFQFQVANLDFHSTSYDWLVVAGARAQFKGSGTINGSGNYGFLLTAIDGQVNGGGGVDRFRIKILDKSSGGVVYDNQMGAADTTDPTTAIGGGSITIQNGKN
jgi:uncharacterized repeat protein (TIGR03803 family)